MKDPRTATSRSRRPGVRWWLAVALVLAVTLSPAEASADPPRPTDFESRILAVSPELPPGFEVSVIGGDAFIELRVPDGHEVVVPDYAQGDRTPAPYLRFLHDGTVEVNESSAAAVINDSRYGAATGSIDPHARPAWTRVADDGVYAWHDHRIHWMSRSTPATMGGSRRVDMGGDGGTWSIDLVVDGSPVVVTGELLLLDAPSPLPWISLAAIAAAVLGLVTVLHVRRAGRPPHAVNAALLAAAAVGAVAVGWAEWRLVPAGAGGSALTVLVPAVATVSALLAAAVAFPRVRMAGSLASVAALGGWAWLRREVWSRAILPTSLPFALDRAVTALALGVAVAVAVVVVWRPPLRRHTARASADT